jgi:NADH-quinone oxidoreductase subunit E
MPTSEIEFSTGLKSFIETWKAKPGSLIMLLHRIQEEFTYIPREAAEKLSRLIDIPMAKIYGVVTFYHFFKTVKPGKKRISVCLGTACYLRGGQDILDECQDILGIKGSEVTEDGLFSVDAVRCIGCCGLAPVMTVGDDVYGKVEKGKLPEIIASYRK